MTLGRRWLVVESSNVGAVRYWLESEKLDVIFRRKCFHESFVFTCPKCMPMPRIFFRYSKVTIEQFVKMLFEDSLGGYFSHEIKAKAEEPERIALS